MKLRHTVLAMVLVVFATTGASCPAPQTQREVIAGVELTAGEVFNQLSTARLTGVISNDATWNCIKKEVTSVVVALDSAERHAEADLVKSNNYLTAARSTITSLRTMVASGEFKCNG